MRTLITGASKGLGKVLGQHFPEALLYDSPHIDYLNLYQWDGKLPPLDVIIHCAGGGLGLKSPQLSHHDLYKLFMVNLGGAVAINGVALIGMRQRGYGRIVHVCSIASGEACGSVGYNTTKAALAAYVRSLGREVAKDGVVVSGIAPGGFLGPSNAMERLRDSNLKEYERFIRERLPRGYMGEAEELVPIIKFLASEEASMMGGSVIPVDAGEGHWYV